MAEYIEREAFVREIDEHRPGPRSYEDAWALTILGSIPAADVVEVVRCADCKYDERCMFQSFVQDERVEPYDKTVFFCADGKRKDGGQEE